MRCSSGWGDRPIPEAAFPVSVLAIFAVRTNSVQTSRRPAAIHAVTDDFIYIKKEGGNKKSLVENDVIAKTGGMREEDLEIAVKVN